MNIVKSVGVFALVFAITLAGEAMAAGEHAHGAKHGGQFVEVEGHQGVEMVVSGDTLIFHITESDKPADLKGASVRAVIQTDSGIKTYPLSVEGSTLRTKLAAPLPNGAKIAISGKDGHGHTLQARFVKK
jgi:hypothetical protein